MSDHTSPHRGTNSISRGLALVLVALSVLGMTLLATLLANVNRVLPPEISVAGQSISNVPQDAPDRNRPQAMQTVLVITTEPTASPWIVYVTATPSPTRVLSTTLVTTATRTRTPTRVGTLPPRAGSTTTLRKFATATRTPTRFAPVLRYPPIALHEPKNQQYMNSDSVVFEWIPVPMQKPGDHFRVLVKRLGAPNWEQTCLPDKPAKCTFPLRGTPRGVRYMWTVVVIDDAHYVVSAPSEQREFYRPLPDDSGVPPAPNPDTPPGPDPNECVPSPDNDYCGQGPPR